MKNLQKRYPERSRKYLRWVKSLDCVASGYPADDPHHGKGLCLMGDPKPSDFFTCPLTRQAHDFRHDHGQEAFEERFHIGEAEAILRTLDRALHEGVITIEVHL